MLLYVHQNYREHGVSKKLTQQVPDIHRASAGRVDAASRVQEGVVVGHHGHPSAHSCNERGEFPNQTNNSNAIAQPLELTVNKFVRITCCFVEWCSRIECDARAKAAARVSVFQLEMHLAVLCAIVALTSASQVLLRGCEDTFHRQYAQIGQTETACQAYTDLADCVKRYILEGTQCQQYTRRSKSTSGYSATALTLCCHRRCCTSMHV
jgi:hypothetical protein